MTLHALDPMLWVPSTLVALVAFGMAVAFLSADPVSPTSRAMAVALAFLGISFGLSVPLLTLQGQAPGYARWLAVSDTISICAFLEWVLRVGRTVPARSAQLRMGEAALRLGQAAAFAYGAAGLAFPELRAREFLGAAEDWQALRRPGFWLFATPIVLAILAGAFSSLLLLGRRPDRPEQVRLLGMMVAIPFLVAGIVLPIAWGTIAMVVGELIFLTGAVHYHVMQGERGQFMSRFLSPQVAELVRRRGFKQALQDRQLELSIVVVDLRGFTAFAEAQSTGDVMRALRDYYRAAGQVAADFGGTIKDMAGDGMLILVGAPLPVSDHALRAIALAAGIRDAVQPLTRVWSARGPALGVGVGVATGKVMVGAIGAGEQYEYTAVGPSVNLASRLCELAADGEVLIAADTVAHCGGWSAGTALEQRSPVAVKGYSHPVAHYNLRSNVLIPHPS